MGTREPGDGGHRAREMREHRRNSRQLTVSMIEERRSDRRYRLRVPVRLGNAVGETREISIGGLYFVTRESVEPGISLSLTISFEACHRDHFDVRYDGRVVRVEPQGDSVGVAVAVQQFAFEAREH